MNRRKLFFWTFVGYLILVVAMTWPLILHLPSHILGVGGDAPLFLWDVWWLKQVWFNSASLFSTDQIFYPQTVSLVFHTLTLVNSAIIAGLSLLINTIMAFNLHFLLSLALTAWLMFIVVRDITRSNLGGWVAGVLFGFSPYIMRHAYGHYNLITLWFIPLCVWLVLKLPKNRQWWIPITAGLVAGLASVNDIYNFIFLFVFIIVWAIWQLIATRSVADRIRLLSRGLVMALVWIAVWSIWLIPAFKENSAVGSPEVLSAQAIDFYSADLARYFVPSQLHPWWGSLAAKIPGPFAGGVENTIFLSWSAPLIGLIFLISLICRRVKLNFSVSPWFWVVLGAVFGILSFGPHLKGLDHVTGISLPYLWLYSWWEGWGSWRVPARFSVMVMFCLAILIGMAISRLPQRRRWLGGAAGVLILIEFLPIPYPLIDLSIPPVYQTIKNDAKASSVLDISWGINSGYWDKGKFISLFAYYGTYHQKKLAIGSVSRTQRSTFDFYSDDQLPLADANSANSFNLLSNDFPTKWKTDWVVIHKKYLTNNSVTIYEQYLKGVGYVLQYSDDNNLGYRLP